MSPHDAQSLQITPVTLDIAPAQFYQLLDLIEGQHHEALHAARSIMIKEVEKIDTAVQSLAAGQNALRDAGRIGRRRGPFDDDDFARDGAENFVYLVYEVFYRIRDIGQYLVDVMEGFAPARVVRIGDAITSDRMRFQSVEEMQRFSLEMSMNRAAMQRFISAVVASQRIEATLAEVCVEVVRLCDAYMQRLRKRHTEGIQIHGDPILTDVAMTVYDHIDRDGEIQAGASPKNLSAYSLRKARLLVGALKTGNLGVFLQDRSRFMDHIRDGLSSLRTCARGIHDAAQDNYNTVREMFPNIDKAKRPTTSFDASFESLDALDPSEIRYQASTKIRTADERFLDGFQNDTIAKIVDLLTDKSVGVEDVVTYVLNRKEELRKYFLETNSFYVCTLSSGGGFRETPGVLEVVPGIRPRVKITDIKGGGVDKVLGFLESMKASATWQSLFLATSPSGSADKSNVLLVGPQGCGKSEILRGIGGATDSISVFAQGSDFLTCWFGEAQKNPKRLFEGALKLQKESGKKVFILIDEIDAILNKDNDFGRANLTTEFQILMDGIVSYPNISVWGATNHPERIPVPMIRRFSKVLVIGELSLEDRVTLLRHYVGFMPVAEDVTDKTWAAAAERLSGVTGDIIRKIADDIWRTKMNAFVRDQPDVAKNLAEAIGVFDRDAFGPQHRATFHAAMPRSAYVTMADITRSIDMHLESVAIQTEIKTAMATYERARVMLAGIPTG